MRRRFRMVSPATVLAGIALLVALGGTGYAAIVLPANSVGTAQLRNNAVVTSKVKDRSLLARDFAVGQIPAGPAGPAGATGAQGPAGPAGPSGAAANYVVHVTSIDVPFATLGTGLASCASGQKATGGGAYLLGTTTVNDQIAVSAPAIGTGGVNFNVPADGQTATSWYAAVYNSGPVTRTLKIFVICA